MTAVPPSTVLPFAYISAELVEVRAPPTKLRVYYCQRFSSEQMVPPPTARGAQPCRPSRARPTARESRVCARRFERDTETVMDGILANEHTGLWNDPNIVIYNLASPPTLG